MLDREGSREFKLNNSLQNLCRVWTKPPSKV